jgi:sulfate transport system permease protein
MTATATGLPAAPHRRAASSAVAAAGWTRGLFIAVTLGFVLVFLVVPLMSVFYEAFRKGWDFYGRVLAAPDSLHAMKMTLIVAAIAVPLNTLFGVAAAWGIAKFEFRGKTLLTTLIDVPFSISPVIAGMVFVLLFGREGIFGGWLAAHQIRIIFALPGMVLATVFVTVPFVARELIPLMEEQGKQEELAAISLGASGWQTFRRITLPNIKWGLLYGVILCNARAMGEFGALSVVSMNYPGQRTLPREIEYLYSNYGGFSIPGAFALSTLLGMLGLVTLVAKSVLEWKIQRDVEGTQKTGEAA